MRLSVLRVGHGPRGTVLLHGFLGSGRNLWSLARAWSARDPSRTFLLMDLTGHGTSPHLPPDPTLDSIAVDVLETAAAEKLPAPFLIVGHSLGGRVAIAALGRDPTTVSRVILLDIGPEPIGAAGLAHSYAAEAFARVPDHFTRREDARRALDGESLPRPTVEWLLTNLVPREAGFGWRVDRQALSDLRPALNATDLWAIARRYPERIRLIRGGLSDYVGEQEAQRLRSAGIEVKTIENASHFVHVDQPAALLADLLAWEPPAARD